MSWWGDTPERRTSWPRDLGILGLAAVIYGAAWLGFAGRIPQWIGGMIVAGAVVVAMLMEREG